MSEESLLLQSERNKSKDIFDLEKFRARIWGGEENVQLRERAIQEISRDTLLNNGKMKMYDLDRYQNRELCVKKFYRAMAITSQCEQNNELKYRDMFWSVLNGTDRALGMRYFIHSKLWMETIQSQGTAAQQQRWIPPAKRLELLGCFAMTELGHSSFLRGAETQATYDIDRKEFVIHSPTVTATKIWQGFAGCTATWCLVLANLSIQKQTDSEPLHCGIQTFVVQIRDEENGNPLPGVAVGDMGPKVGLNGIDNGWIQFNYVRVPRDRMLARWASVEEDGTFNAPPNPAIAYASTVTERVTSLLGSPMSTDPALTIAIRFSLLRRQGPNNEQIIDYQSQQERLMPHLASTFAFRFAGYQLSEQWRQALAALENGDGQFLLQKLPDIHSTSCGMKAFSTWWGQEAQEMCRRAMGGFAFHSFSGIPHIINDFHVMTTGGGDNVVIAQQTANFLLKSFKKASNQKQVSGSVAYLSQLHTILTPKSEPVPKGDLKDHQHQKQLLVTATIRKLAQVAQSISNDTSTNRAEVFNNHLCELIEVVKLHSYLFAFDSFVDAIMTTDDKKVQAMLSQLCTLFILHFIHTNSALFLETNTLTTTTPVRNEARGLSKDIRQVAASLVDALHVPDIVLGSSLGVFDGDIYNRFLSDMKESRDSTKVPDYWFEIIQPKLKSNL